VILSWVGSWPRPQTLGLSGTNALAYYEKLQLTAVKSFMTLAPGQGEKATDAALESLWPLAVVLLHLAAER
jgi:hypothetical protein